jgi:hypothetical protein
VRVRFAAASALKRKVPVAEFFPEEAVRGIGAFQCRAVRFRYCSFIEFLLFRYLFSPDIFLQTLFYMCLT